MAIFMGNEGLKGVIKPEVSSRMQGIAMAVMCTLPCADACLCVLGHAGGMRV